MKPMTEQEIAENHYEAGKDVVVKVLLSAWSEQDRLKAEVGSLRNPWCDDISKAPRDGTRVLLYFSNMNDGRWIGKFAGEKWFTGNGPAEIEPVAWMPLPTPPETK